MPRRARITLPGTPIHVIQRGNNRGPCFFVGYDYRVYLQHLDELSARFGCAIHAYVLMTNHVHLLLTPERVDSVSLMMKHLGQRYVQHINRRQRRSGTLWEGRFRSCIVQEEAYLLRCYRYIELNPVRAQIVRHPRDFRWSSYRFNAEGAFSAFLAPHALYRNLGKSSDTRRIAYQELFRDGLEPAALDAIRQATNGNFVLGTDQFGRKVEHALGRRATPGRPGRPPSEKPQQTARHQSRTLQAGRGRPGQPALRSPSR